MKIPAFLLMAALALLAQAVLSSAQAADGGNSTPCDGCAAVGTVNVTLVEQPDPFTGFFSYEPLDLGKLLDGIRSFFASLFG